MTVISWRANVSGEVNDPEKERDLLRLLDALCRFAGGSGIYVSDGVTRGAAELPLRQPLG